MTRRLRKIALALAKRTEESSVPERFVEISAKKVVTKVGFEL